ncbi:MAG TPA: hypothetical protein PKG54_02845 [Phycisphaerae bacterium]|jgi:hypothetical protein|nr:hypothetical protein [Phycisphaerae bacterium]HOB73441.1 hypothetical protein [Phycisphaerae bacterium]HOJ55968.1 hypothetical protein [Phycisphaerae bacterium]HOL25658.1 hypothetical protein [Phycisphaerae bacterium]HPP22120.1 hypothetical protein [Phycisphaerae bacterium]
MSRLREFRLREWWLIGLIALFGALSLGSDCDIRVRGFGDGFFVDIDDDDDFFDDFFDDLEDLFD